MRTLPCFPALIASLLLTMALRTVAGEPELSVSLLPGKVRVNWTTPPGDAPHALTTRRWQLQRSPNLSFWVPEGAEMMSTPESGTGQMFLDVPLAGDRGFFRLQVRDEPAFLAAEGEEVFGYASALAARMAENTGVTPQNFPALYPPGDCLDHISFDVATADYWAEWNADPVVWNAALPPGSTDQRLTDFRLDAPSLAKLRTNGFVVSEPRGSISFTDLYYRIWTDDLPVYVSSDSILHAWHRTWITMLEEIEELALRGRLVTLVNDLQTHLNASAVPAALTQGKSDALGFINTARSLVNYVGTIPIPSTGTQYGRAVRANSAGLNEPFFGDTRIVDWTQFGPRAHYANSETLKSYFRTMMWLGLIDMRIDERSPLPENALRQLAASVVLTLALNDAGLMDNWQEIDDVLTPFVGRADSLTPPQLLEILQSENLGALNAFTGPDKLETLLTRIKSGQAGVQDILAHPIHAPLSETKLVLPRSFTFFGQRFTPESWALGRMVFDNIWRENPNPVGTDPMIRIHRRLPSALDINFAVMGNNTPAALLSQRMTASGVPFRDGHDFSRELISIRQVIDSQGPAAWSGSLYLHQLDALRSLSTPLPATVPEAMRTEAWKWKTVHTQLAGWTELRHDNLLYAKQSYTPPILCFYPAGYVEPRPAFYAAMKRLVDFASATLADVPMSGTYSGLRLDAGTPSTRFVNLVQRKAEWLAHFASMSATLQSLTGIAQTELDHQPVSAAQTDFIRSLVQSVYEFYVYNDRTYSGWYPKMYLESVFTGTLDPHPSEMWDPLVVDVHTDGPDPVITGDPGAVLYNATGNVALMLVAIDVNGQRCLHGGPVFTYYEFTDSWGTTRLTDQTWKAQVRAQQQPVHPEWTTSWLTPGPITVPPNVP